MLEQGSQSLRARELGRPGWGSARQRGERPSRIFAGARREGEQSGELELTLVRRSLLRRGDAGAGRVRVVGALQERGVEHQGPQAEGVDAEIQTAVLQLCALCNTAASWTSHVRSGEQIAAKECGGQWQGTQET